MNPPTSRGRAFSGEGHACSLTLIGFGFSIDAEPRGPNGEEQVVVRWSTAPVGVTVRKPPLIDVPKLSIDDPRIPPPNDWISLAIMCAASLALVTVVVSLCMAWPLL